MEKTFKDALFIDAFQKCLRHDDVRVDVRAGIGAAAAVSFSNFSMSYSSLMSAIKPLTLAKATIAGLAKWVRV